MHDASHQEPLCSAPPVLQLIGRVVDAAVPAWLQKDVQPVGKDIEAAGAAGLIWSNLTLTLHTALHCMPRPTPSPPAHPPEHPPLIQEVLVVILGGGAPRGRQRA